MRGSDIRITALTEHAQFEACVALQDEVWGYEPAARMTQKVFLLAANIGGQVLGAYDSDTLAGYAMSLPGIRDGRAYLHSHHLAVLPPWRRCGLGRRLKLAQRDDALLRGIELMEWTFDPLGIVNAHLNIARLGAISRRYRRDFYGPSSSPLQGGLPTDRLVAEWWLRSERVEVALAGGTPAMEAVSTVNVPREIAAWKAEAATRARALEVQARNAAAMERAFAEGLAVVGFEYGAEGAGRYLLGKWDERMAVELS